MPDANWVTGEAALWLDNDEVAYHESRRIVKDADVRSKHGTVLALKNLLTNIVPDHSYGVVEHFDDIDWDYIIERLEDDIKEGYE
jgi:hypothetical protein